MNRKRKTRLITLLLFAVYTTIASAQPTASRIDTSDWKTYRNETMGFEVQYPNSWHVSKGTGIGTESVRLGETPQADKPNLSVEFWVQRKINPKGLSIGEWYADQLQGFKAATPTTTETVIGGRPTIHREVVGTLGKHHDFFTSLNETDVFEITITQPSSQAQLDQTYEYILSTVRFINSP